MTEETKANRNFLDEMEGIVVFENSERELSEDHKKDLMALDELHSRLCEEFEKKEEQLLTANSQIELLVQTQNRDSKELIDFGKTIRNQEQQLQAKDEEIKELNEKIGKDNVVDYHYHRKREFELLKEIEELKNKENRSDGIIGGLLNEGKSLQNKLQQAKDRAYRCLMYLSEKGEYQYLGLSEAVDLIEKEIKETLEIINKE